MEMESGSDHTSLIAGAALLVGLYLTSFYSYTLFHSLAELFSIVIAFGIFVIAWNSRPFLANNYLVLIGIAYLFIGGIDLAHTLAYKGMGVFKTYDANHPTQLWIAARYMESLSLLIAPLFVGRRLNHRAVLASYTVIFLVLIWSIFGNDIFPVCYIDGVGLTPFKKNSEYVISVVLLVSGAALLRKKTFFDRKVLFLILFSIAATIVSELAFTFYVGVYDLSNLVGHLFKIISFYLIYLAIIKTGIRDPFDIIFRDLKCREEELREAKEDLELRVVERTNELSKSNELLRRLNRQLRAIRRCNQTLLHATDEQSLLNDICRIICDEVGYLMAWVGYAGSDEAKTVRPVAWAGVENSYLATANITWADTERGRGPSGSAIRRGEIVYIEDFTTNPSVAPWRESALKHGYRSSIALPLKDDRGITFGVLNIYSTEPGAFTPDEIGLMEELTRDLAFGVTVLRARLERRRAEQGIALMNFALNNVREAAFLIDENARFQYVNEESCRILGYAGDELLGLCVADVDPDFPVERWHSHWDELIKRGSLTFEGRHRAKDGRIFPVEISANYFEYDGRGYNLALVRDITERRRAEEELRRSEADLREAQRVAHIGSWDWDAVNDTIWWSEEYYRIYGLEPGTPTPDYVEHLKAYTPESAVRLDSVVKRALETGEPYELDLELAKPSERTRWVIARGEPKRDVSGQVVGLRGTAQDITRRKRAETEREQYFRLFRNSSDLMVIADPSGTFIKVNPACTETLGYSEDELVARPFIDFIHPDDKQSTIDEMARQLQRGFSLNFENRYICKDGSLRWLSWRASYNEAEGLTYATARDITEHKKAEREIRKLNEELEQKVIERTAALQSKGEELQENQHALMNLVEDLNLKTGELEAVNKKLKELDRLKSMFIASMSHELRTPLNSIIGFTGVILMGMTGDITDEQRKQLGMVRESANHLLALINDIIDLSKIEAGKVDVSIESFDLPELLREVEHSFTIAVKTKGLMLSVTAPEKLLIESDRRRVKQVVVNFLSNAVKFTETGEIVIGAAETDGSVEISVRDTGIGIKESDIGRLFRAFSQIGAEGAAREGSGLGLYICKRIAGLLGGEITVRAEFGRGSTFTLVLPLQYKEMAK